MGRAGLAKNMRLADDGKYRWHWDPRLIERMDPHAQQEIRDYANAMYALIAPIVPITEYSGGSMESSYTRKN